jgi:hypothetical protein
MAAELAASAVNASVLLSFSSSSRASRYLCQGGKRPCRQTHWVIGVRPVIPSLSVVTVAVLAAGTVVGRNNEVPEFPIVLLLVEAVVWEVASKLSRRGRLCLEAEGR